MERIVVVIIDKGFKAKVLPGQGLRVVLNSLSSTLTGPQITARVQKVREDVKALAAREGWPEPRPMPDDSIIVETTDNGVVALAQIEGVKGLSENGKFRPAKEFTQTAAPATGTSSVALKATA